eukprot:861047-Prymnesium_polylepis.1
MTKRDERRQTAARRAEIVGGAASGRRGRGRGAAQCSASGGRGARRTLCVRRGPGWSPRAAERRDARARLGGSVSGRDEAR